MNIKFKRKYFTYILTETSVVVSSAVLQVLFPKRPQSQDVVVVKKNESAAGFDLNCIRHRLAQPPPQTKRNETKYRIHTYRCFYSFFWFIPMRVGLTTLHNMDLYVHQCFPFVSNSQVLSLTNWYHFGRPFTAYYTEIEPPLRSWIHGALVSRKVNCFSGEHPPELKYV